MQLSGSTSAFMWRTIFLTKRVTARVTAGTLAVTLEVLYMYVYHLLLSVTNSTVHRGYLTVKRLWETKDIKSGVDPPLD